MSSPLNEPEDTLFLPTPFSVLWCFSRGKFYIRSAMLHFFVCFSLCLPPSLSRFHSPCSRVQTSCWGSKAGGTPRQGLNSGEPDLRPGLGSEFAACSPGRLGFHLFPLFGSRAVNLLPGSCWACELGPARPGSADGIGSGHLGDPAN